VYPSLSLFCLTALRVLLTLTVIINITIARMALSTHWGSGTCPDLIIIILIDYPILIRWSTILDVVCHVLPAVWWLNLCPDIITPVPRKTLTGAFNLGQAGYLQIRAIDLILKGTGVLSAPMFALVAGYIKLRPSI
jgi:hypothetical protein